jgi:riboflavin biosynthesis pyrimidine reductase
VSDADVRIERLFEAPADIAIDLPPELEAAYGGGFALADRIVYANFVSTIDGIAALAGVQRSSAVISGGAPADRFVMALLRGVADAVVVGSGTLREHGGPWTAERAFPAAAHAFRQLRAGRAAPTLAVVTASGDLPEDAPAVADAIVITTASGAARLETSGVRPAEVLEAGVGDRVDPRLAIDRLRDRGFERILTEGGPSLMGSMLEAGVVDEIFLTVSPALFGGGPGRPPLTDGADLLGGVTGARLLGVRRSLDHLFLRYRVHPEADR